MKQKRVVAIVHGLWILILFCGQESALGDVTIHNAAGPNEAQCDYWLANENGAKAACYSKGYSQMTVTLPCMLVADRHYGPGPYGRSRESGEPANFYCAEVGCTNPSTEGDGTGTGLPGSGDKSGMDPKTEDMGSGANLL
jgi:hypothetical protein